MALNFRTIRSELRNPQQMTKWYVMRHLSIIDNHQIVQIEYTRLLLYITWTSVSQFQVGKYREVYR